MYKTYSRYFVLVLLSTVFFACAGTSEKDLTPTSVPVTIASITPIWTLTPFYTLGPATITNTPTVTSLPLVTNTPLATLSAEAARQKLQSMLDKNGDCALPC